jgi:hypothetical protein
MNKLIFLFCITFMTLTSFDSKALDINITLTSLGGCKFHIQGDLSLSWTGGFESFSGTVTASGGDGCANGTWQFGMNAVVDEDHRIQAYRFRGNSPLVDILKDEGETLDRLIVKFESAKN